MIRKTMSWLTVGVASVGTLALMPGSADAGEWQRKAGRGLNNIAFGVVEIPRTVQNVSQQHGGGAGMTWGVIKGVGRCLKREGVGVFEVVTAPWNTRPVMQPEFLLSDDKPDYDPPPLW